MAAKKGRLTQDVLRAVCIVVIILGEVIDPVTASFVDSCESDTAAIRRSSPDWAVKYPTGALATPSFPLIPSHLLLIIQYYGLFSVKWIRLHFNSRL